MGKLFIALSVICLLALAGCFEQPVEKNYFPLDKARELHYNYSLTIISPEGKQSDSAVLTIKPLAEKKADNTKCLEFAFLFDNEQDHSECYYQNNQGIFLAERKFGADTIAITPHMPLLKKPFESGTKWTWNGSEGEISSIAEFEIEGIEIIEINGKEYETLVVSSITERLDGARINSRAWYADGIGLIKEKAKITNSNYPGTKMEIEVEVK